MRRPQFRFNCFYVEGSMPDTDIAEIKLVRAEPPDIENR